MSYTLIDAMMQPCVIRQPTITPDGEGGSSVTWSDGPKIRAAITAHRSTKIREGEHDTTRDTHNVTTPIDTEDLTLLAVIRDGRGRTYRILSEPREFPHVMSKRYKRYSAEAWEETT